ncbi:hypothetical protein LOTGIDRAFT_141654 [Lottia gigantea]|uniref:Ig-like domain-containing protein n=1 Tax=Lottia gigantea TaxID=225164 RepID=V4B0P8_LOTGI|nr:hypothetical protein LOTGIDRAFT_141654 [Lottia gigantea]ESO99781.1 hypothetical protein LOTGIDRAFT_141654 [Lottia gigantea]
MPFVPEKFILVFTSVFILQEFTVSGFERKLMEEINYRDGKIKMMSETETEYDSEQPEERVINTQPPEILQQLNDTQLIEGGDATFVCKIMGKPRPKIAWYRNGKRIKKSNRYDITYGQDNMSVLKIRVTLPEDTGYYTVLAVNSVGKATTSAQLYVDKLGNIDATSFMEPESLKKMLKRGKKGKVSDDGGVFDAPAAPQFKKIPDDLTASEGTTVRFDCLVTGRPAPELDWYRDGILVHRDDNHKIVVNENGIHSLIIKFVSRRDAGTYNCLALNKAGEDRFTITLNVTPKEEKQPPRFIERVQNFTVKEGNPVTLSCHAVGMPTPLMSWQKDGHHVTPTHDMRVNTEGGRSALYIEDTKLSDAAWYQCTAANTSGSATTRAKLVVQGMFWIFKPSSGQLVSWGSVMCLSSAQRHHASSSTELPFRI